MPQNKNQHLANQIKDFLSAGIYMSPESLEFLESVYGLTSPQELDFFLSQKTDSENISVQELILFPTSKLRLEIEPFLQADIFEEEDLDQIATALTRSLTKIPVFFQANEPASYLELSLETAKTFITRLYPTKRIPTRCLEACQENYPKKVSLWIQIFLRSSQLKFEQSETDFLLSFFENFSHNFKEFWEYFTFFVSLLEEKNQTSELFEIMAQKKLLLEKALNKSTTLQNQIQNQPVEVLLSQKLSILCLDPEEIQKNLQIVDDLCFSIYGQIPPASYFESYYFI